MWTPRAPLCLLLTAALAACGNGGADENQSVLDDTARPARAAEPDRIVVDHILVGVKSPKLPSGRYGPDRAREVAYSLLEKLNAGGDWTALKREHSDDPPPGGPYAMANRGVMARRGEHRRDGMVPAFGDVGFRLEVDEIAIADYDPRTSPFGYHIIKRVK